MVFVQYLGTLQYLGVKVYFALKKNKKVFVGIGLLLLF